MDHDRLFKQLLTTFFIEFVELFLPDLATFLHPGSVEFLDKEVFTDVTAGERHEVDLLAKGKLRDTDTFFLIHVENQASAREDFPSRMFRYFARLHEKFDLPVYPIALFSYDSPRREAPKHYEVRFPDRRVLHFSYRVIQLNRLNWRNFIRQPNPVATALMTRMRIGPGDRPRVRLECLRMLATLRLNAARSELIYEFMQSYLALGGDELMAYNKQLGRLKPSERKVVMETRDLLDKSGILRVLLRQLTHRFGPISIQLQDRILRMDTSTLEQLGEALFEFSSARDVESWVARHT